MPSREYDGPAIDAIGQHISDAPYWQGEGETVDIVTDDATGEERVENVPAPTSRPDTDGQTTLDEWG